MAKTTPASVDAYLAAQPPDARRALAQVREAIRKALPEAEEGLSYGMPTCTWRGRYLVYYAGWKAHYSLYPATRYVMEALGDALTPYVVHKGTIRLPLDADVPVRLIARIVKARAREEAEAGRVGRSAKTAPSTRRVVKSARSTRGVRKRAQPKR
ncbi:MAG: DUF1801 domain-containing protein [Vicinamibacterales bacterium]